MKQIKKEKYIEHPMEEVLDIESGTTVVEYTEHLPAEIVKAPTYDEKDDEIEIKLEEIYTAAMGTAGTISDEMERVEGKYKARVGEVTAAMLNVALGTVREKRELKKHKDTTTPSGNGSSKNITNNNLVVADRNEILRALMGKSEE